MVFTPYGGYMMNDTKPDSLLEVGEVSRRLGLKVSTIRRMIHERRIEVFRPGRRAVRISERTVQEILAKGRSPAMTR